MSPDARNYEANVVCDKSHPAPKPYELSVHTLTVVLAIAIADRSEQQQADSVYTLIHLISTAAERIPATGNPFPPFTRLEHRSRGINFAQLRAQGDTRHGRCCSSG